MEPIVQKGHEGLVHHILLYECPDSFPTSFLNHSGLCYDEATPEEIMKCSGQSVVAAWAIGGGVRFCLIIVPSHNQESKGNAHMSAVDKFP